MVCYAVAMGKTVYETTRIEITRKCPYCGEECNYEGVAFARAGKVDLWRCPKHGLITEKI